MSRAQDHPPELPGGIRERPWLLPYNRRLRHLQGISIRNISFSGSRNRRRGESIDDEALPTSLRSPAKIVAQREHRGLEHSRSQTDLRPIKEHELKDNVKSRSTNNDGEKRTDGAATPTRPIRKLRRRSTFDWGNATPRVRQERLEDAIAEKLANVFFSLHVEGQDKPIYISEVVEQTMNPNFRSFNMDSCGPLVTRQGALTVKVWAKNDKMDDYQYLVELHVNLRGLQFIGKTLENYDRPLPANCIIFHLTDGIYTSFSDVSASTTEYASAPKSSMNRILPTSSYDALMRLATLDQCIQDALATREQIERQINDLLGMHREPLDVVQSVPIAQERASEVEHALHTEQKRLQALHKKRNDLQSSIKSRTELIATGYTTINEQQALLPTLRNDIASTRNQVSSVADDITGQRRRIAEDLQSIFPIDPLPNKSLHFTILNLYLPNSESYDDADPDDVSAALGYVAHIVYNLALYLSTPLPYPVHPMGSTSTIDDPISNIASQTAHPVSATSSSGNGMSGRTYPLFLRSAVRYRFDYALFLLNKDIELLSSSMGLKVMDIRQTLPNLKYLLYIVGAGVGELPARKAGGVRGLLAAHSDGLRRTGSQESVGSEPRGRAGGSGAVEELRRAIAGGGGGGKGKEKEKANGVAVKPNGNVMGKKRDMGPPLMPASAAKAALQAQKAGLGSRLRDAG